LSVFKDKETSTELSTTYTLYQQDIEYQDFSEEQIEFLLSDEFVQQRISELPTDEESNEISLDTETNEYETVKWLFENKKILAERTYAAFFEKIIGKEEDSENRMRGKTIDEIAEILTFANPILSLIPDGKLNTQPQTLYGLIVNDRKMPHPSYPHPQHDQQSNFIDECINEEKYVGEIKDFVINIYRISNNNISVVTEIDKLLKNTNLDGDFLQLIKKGYSLNHILDLIFDDDNNYKEEDKFKEKDRLILLEHCFNQQNDKKQFVISDDKAKKKLNDLLVFAQKEKSNDVFALLENLAEQERYKNLLTSLIIEKDSEFINSLPTKLLNLAVSSFKKENHNDFANNFDFLTVIMLKGTVYQKGYVVKLLTDKLDDNKDIEQTLNLIDSMDNIPSFDKSGLLYSHLDAYQQQNSDNISKEIDDRIKHLKKKIK